MKEMPMPSPEKSTVSKEGREIDKQKLTSDLTEMLGELYAETGVGIRVIPGPRDARAEKEQQLQRSRGFVDGYMKALVATGVFTSAELKELIKKEKENVRPSSR